MYTGHNELELECIDASIFWTKKAETFGDYIRNLRIMKGLSQKKVAEINGVCHATIIRWEKGRVIPARDELISLISSLGGDAWDAINYDGVLTGRQHRILSHFEEAPYFRHKDCVELIGNEYLRDDLKYLVSLGILEEEKQNSKLLFRIKRHGKPKSLGELIRKHRLESGMFARQLASIVGVTEDTVLNWEKNRTHPDHEHLLLLKEHIKINPMDITKFSGTITKRERDILELVRERESVTSRECQKMLGLKQKDAQNALYFLYKLGVLNRELGIRKTAKYYIIE